MLLLLSLISGAVVWWEQTVQSRLDPLDAPASFSVRGWLVLHGWLNPFLCVLFGYLCVQHVHPGWESRASRLSGAAMLIVFGGLILTGAGLYYVGSEGGRTVLVWAHRLLGVLWPLALAGHGWQGIRAAKRTVNLNP